MKKFLYILAPIIFLCQISANSFGYLRIVEASFCMDDCAAYVLESESGESYSDFFTNINDIDLTLYLDRYVEIVSGGEHQCVECSAQIIDAIYISDSCDYPISCFSDPCEVANECQLNTPVECVSNYCGGCNADFYSLNGDFVDCYNVPMQECNDLTGIFFGWCDMYMGVGFSDGYCNHISGCGWIVDGVDYTDAFYDSIEECELDCDSSDLTCNQIEQEYALLHSGEYVTCNQDSDCTAIWGDCAVGLGGCHYSVNSFFSYNESSDLVNQWIDGGCMGGVCDCMSLPNAICSDGQCDLTYCDTPNPAGCFQTGCQDGYDCVDFGNSEYADFCVSSGCDCSDEYVYESYWMCLEDCNGGTCVPENPQPGDLCIVNELATGSIPGFVECDGECIDYMYYSWVGDGWCDDSACGVTLNCEGLDCDGGDCPDSWCGCVAGDANGDGTTDIIDIVLIVNCILDDTISCSCSDLNYDFQINIMDVILVVSMIIEN